MTLPKVIIGSDHGGFDLKENIRLFLQNIGFTVQDFGCYSSDSVDYPDIAFLVATTVANNNETFGIMIDTYGVASGMVCNKIPGIRAAVVWNQVVAKSSREHNNANVITMGGKIIDSQTAQIIVKEWLETKYAGGRHERRVEKIREVERHFLKYR